MTVLEFENKWVELINNGLLKSFPKDFITDNYENDIRNTKKFKVLDLPNKLLIKGAKIFGEYEIIDTDGKPVYQSKYLSQIKYILYASRTNPKQIKIFDIEEMTKSIVRKYENHLDEIIVKIKNDFKNNFKGSKDFVHISSRIFKLVNLVRY